MASLGTLALDVVAKTAPFERSLGRAQKKTGSFAQTIDRTSSKSLANMHAGLNRVAVGAAAMSGALVAGGIAIGKFAIDAGRDLEKTRVGFKVMLGDAKLADEVMQDLFDFSKRTPFEPTELFSSGRQLLAAEFTPQEMMKTVSMLGDVAAGSQSKLGELVAAYAQVGATGRAELGDINKFANRGIPIFAALAKSMGVGKSEIRELASKGKIGLEELEGAFEEMTKKGGTFFGAMEEQSKTVDGQISTLKGNLTAIAGDFGEAALKSSDFATSLGDVNAALAEFNSKQAAKETMKETAKAMQDVNIGFRGFRDLVQTIDINTGGMLSGQDPEEMKKRRAKNRAPLVRAAFRQMMGADLGKNAKPLIGKSARQIENEALAENAKSPYAGRARGSFQGVAGGSATTSLNAVSSSLQAVAEGLQATATKVSEKGFSRAQLEHSGSDASRGAVSVLQSILKTQQKMLEKLDSGTVLKVKRGA